MTANQAQQEYWVVRCYTCGEVIPLARLWRKENYTKKPLDLLIDPPAFEASCDAGHRGTYTMCEFKSWLGPASREFRDHPAIKYCSLES